MTTSDKSGWNLEFLENFVCWLAEKVVEATDKFKNNPSAYNHYILQNLSWAKRYGKIKRQDFWNILGNETIRPDIGLGEG